MMAILDIERERMTARASYLKALREDDSAWKTPGCGPNCHVIFPRFDGRPYPERLVVHDPGNHEAYGLNVLALGSPTRLNGVVRTGALEIDGTTISTRLDGRPLHLTPVEFGMLSLLAAHVGTVVSKNNLLRSVWGPTFVVEHGFPSTSHSDGSNAHLLRVNMSRLRGKLGLHRDLIVTSPTYGYLLRQVEPLP